MKKKNATGLMPFQHKHVFEGPVFKLLTDSAGQLLAIETRHEQKQEVSFSVLDLRAGQLLFKEMGLDENWWAGMSALEQGRLFLYRFADKRFPDPKGIIAVDVQEQQIIWEDTELYLEKAYQGQLIAVQRLGDQRRYLLLDAASGNPQQELQPDEVGKLWTDLPPLVYPVYYDKDSRHFESIRQFLQLKLQLEACQGVEYLEYGSCIALSYYLSKEEHLANYLLLLDKKGELLAHECLYPQVKAVSTETFFVVSGQLITIKEKQQLLVFYLLD